MSTIIGAVPLRGVLRVGRVEITSERHRSAAGRPLFGLGLGRLDEAEASYRRAIEIDPDYAAAHYNLGVILADQGRLDEAEASYRRTIELDPDDAAAHTNLGLVLTDQKRLIEAEASHRRAIELDPDDAVARSNLEPLLRERGRPE